MARAGIKLLTIDIGHHHFEFPGAAPEPVKAQAGRFGFELLDKCDGAIRFAKRELCLLSVSVVVCSWYGDWALTMVE